MDKLINDDRKPTTFNGPLEAGIRIVSILGAGYPLSFDLQRLVAFDYLLVHTADVGGPESLHPSTPLHTAELLVRRKIVEKALLLMMTRNLVERQITAEGIRYSAGDNAATFLASVSSTYLVHLKKCAYWLVNELGGYTDQDFKVVMRRFFDRWVEEFQSVEHSKGNDA